MLSETDLQIPEFTIHFGAERDCRKLPDMGIHQDYTEWLLLLFQQCHFIIKLGNQRGAPLISLSTNMGELEEVSHHTMWPGCFGSPTESPCAFSMCRAVLCTTLSLPGLCPTWQPALSSSQSTKALPSVHIDQAELVFFNGGIFLKADFCLTGITRNLASIPLSSQHSTLSGTQFKNICFPPT